MERSPNRPWHRARATIAIAAGFAVAVVAVALAFVAPPGSVPLTGAGGVHTRVATPSAPVVSVPIANLPEARYDAVVPGLIPITGVLPTSSLQIATIKQDIALFDANRDRAVARLAAKDFLATPTTVVVARSERGWSLILTPARQALPSTSSGHAPAQSAGWARSSELHALHSPTARIDVSIGSQSLSITEGGVTTKFNVGVGTPENPSPANVTGYLEARYLDPSQGQSRYPIQLTSLHSQAVDSPFGSTGGLIGIHFEAIATGQVSHGCIRLPAEAITAVNRLPLGTPITIVQ